MKQTIRDLIMDYIYSLPSTVWHHSYDNNTNWEDDTRVFERTLKNEDKLIKAIEVEIDKLKNLSFKDFILNKIRIF